jgi:hypothetical protein
MSPTPTLNIYLFEGPIVKLKKTFEFKRKILINLIIYRDIV